MDALVLMEGLESRAMMSALPTPNHIVVVIEENQAYAQVVGVHSAPYINALARGGATFTTASAETHPSLANYLAIFSGSRQGVSGDAKPTRLFSTPNIASELIAVHHTFAGYSEDLPRVGYTGDAYKGYVRRHNPWVDFNNVPAGDNLPFAKFPADFSKLPTVSFVVPNLNHDMHDGTVGNGDRWLKAKLGAYAYWARTHNSLLIVTWDEDDGSTDSNHIATIVYGAHVKPGKDTQAINHYSILRTIEDMYKLPRVGQSAAAAPITNAWR